MCHTSPSAEVLQRMALALDVSVSVLLSETDDTAAQLLADYAAADETGRALIAQFAAREAGRN